MHTLVTPRRTEPSVIDCRSVSTGRRVPRSELRDVSLQARTDPAAARRRGLASIARHLQADHVRLADRSGTTVTQLDAATGIWSDGAPWGCATVRAEHFLFIADATELPAGSGRSETLGDLGVHSLLHLPIRDHGRSLGSADVAWNRHVAEWDDRDGALVRELARVLLRHR